MAFRIEDIRGALKLGGARPTLFQVKLTLPSIVPNGLDISRDASFMIQASAIPGSTISAIEVPYFGRKIRVAGDRTFQPWSVSILNDEDFKIRQGLETWHNKINSLEGNVNTTGSSAPNNYKTDAYVYQYAKSGGASGTTPAIIRTYKFVGLFPTEISPIDLDWNRTDEIETFQVQFAYDYYVVEGPTAGGTIK